MISLRKIYLFTKHEMFSEGLDLKVISLVVLALVNILITLNFSYNAFTQNELSSLTSNVPLRYLWVVISYSPTFFIYLIGIVVGGELFSKDFEKGITTTMYTFPASRLDIFLGKVLGGVLVSFIYTIIIESASLISSYAVFGSLIDIPPSILLIMIISYLFSQLIFYSISVYLGIKTRKRTTAIIFSIVLILVLPLIDYYIGPVYQAKNIFINFLIDMIPHRALDLPMSITYKLLGISSSPYNIVTPFNAIISIIFYTIVFLGFSAIKFLKTDYI